MVVGNGQLLVVRWELFAQHRVGIQMGRVVDSIGANITEGTGGGRSKVL
ncbi:MAG: hypothetical protein ACE5HI_14340 [bacterium]